MTTITIILFLLGGLWALRELIVGFWVWQRRRHYRHLHRVEVTQRFFGEVRDSLLDLVRQGQLSDQSETFRFFHFFDTFVLRRPDAYPQISSLLRQLLLSETDQSISSRLHEESQRWTSDTQKVVEQHAEALESLVISHSRLLRYLHNWWHSFSRLIPSPNIMDTARSKAKMFVYQQEDQTTQGLRAGQTKLRDLVGGRNNHFIAVG